MRIIACTKAETEPVTRLEYRLHREETQVQSQHNIVP